MAMFSRTILSVFVGSAILIGVTATCVYFFVFKGPVDATEAVVDLAISRTEKVLRIAKKVIDEVEEKTGIRSAGISGGETIIESTQRIAEIAVIRKDYTDSFSWEHNYLGSSKRIEIRGEFTAKAGYRLASPMELRFDTTGGSVDMVLPESELLSNEMTGFRIITDEDGWWNRLDKDDREMATKSLLRKAGRKILEAGILEQADLQMEDHVRDAVREATDSPIEVRRTRIEP